MIIQTYRMAEDFVLKTVLDIQRYIGYCDLPVYGFRDPNFHVFVCTPYFREFLKNIIGPFHIIGQYLLQDWVKDPILQFPMPSWMADAFEFIDGIGKRHRRLGVLRSFMFFGVQPLMSWGLTSFRDHKIDSSEDSMMHYVLHPSEYIIYGASVHACTDGEIIHIEMNKPDDFRNDNPINTNDDDEDWLGNIIRVKKGPIEVTYAGLKQWSSRLKVGDKIRKGDVIAKVGCSSFLKQPFLYLRFGFHIPTFQPAWGQLTRMFRHEYINWDSHYQIDLTKHQRYGAMDDTPDHSLIFKNLDPHNLRYNTTGNKIKDAILVKKFPVIFSE